jgi:hypothetical protein
MKIQSLLLIPVLSVIFLQFSSMDPAFAKECQGFNGSYSCTWREYRTHCKKVLRCSAQYRDCRSNRQGNNATTQTCSDWQNRF